MEEDGAGVLELDGRVLELLEELLEELGAGVLELDDSGAPPQLASPRAANIDKMQTIFFILAFFCSAYILRGTILSLGVLS